MNDRQEICYLPTWPIGFPDLPEFPGLPSGPGRQQKKLNSFDLRTMAIQSFAGKMSNTMKLEPDEWIRPQPKCISRVEPYDF